MSLWDSIDSWSNYTSAPPSKLEEVLYQHWQESRQSEPPDQVIARFRKLFVEALGYPDPEVWSALTSLAQRSHADRQFKYTLNRCCYTLINPWYTEARYHWAIPELISVFEDLPEAMPYSLESKKIRALVRDFTTSDQYATLSRLKQFFLEPKTTDQAPSLEEELLGQRIRHYPFLYDNSLLTKDSSQEQKQNVLDLRRKAEKDLRLNLIRYQSNLQGHSRKARVVNPTLLNDHTLSDALNHYTGKFDGHRTQKDWASWFVTFSKTTRSFRDFKDEFVEYLIQPIAAIEPKYADNHFTRQLRTYLRDTLSDFDDQRLNDFILVETCRKILNYLVVDRPLNKRPEFRTFRYLLNDIGHTLTVGLLLRVVLFCSMARPWLERCFSVLFNLHEQKHCKEVPWLVETLEHTNIALISNFGGFSYLATP
ncbi:hypothetical protein [Pseudanabaena sp. FACHB-2040]|uniref:hypothetical protein n=1 Tax=Pseudanabaena sp. FACHB-2040 TaxID=2692859 RepID=UPI001F558FC3|nr:hypothetical protein [Pseudanabaena sp. FACHB-2040]